MFINKKPCSFKTIDISGFPFQQDDDKDFHITAVDKNILTDSIPERDDEKTFAQDMYNFGDEDNLPNSDRIMECQRHGISQNKCLDV